MKLSMKLMNIEEAIEQLTLLDAKLTEAAEYLRATEEGLRQFSRDRDSEGAMHPVHAANRLRIVADQISRKEK